MRSLAMAAAEYPEPHSGVAAMLVCWQGATKRRDAGRSVRRLTPNLAFGWIAEVSVGVKAGEARAGIGHERRLKSQRSGAAQIRGSTAPTVSRWRLLGS